ncbi:MAG TPA: YggS family pyridoxal phosphate-dependent enzyme [Methylophilaceae bacterium]|nr:YggS family pyridoxal phosphate-dependent enzyme [Methylophilaceae bacterium]
MTTIATRLQAVQQRIRAAESAAGRPSDSVTLLAVSKAQPASAIRAAFDAGQRRFGENYLQEALDKQAQLSDLDIEWHFIGPIQSNKTQPIAQHFTWVHGVDRLKIAERLNTARPAHLPPLQICIQVNVSNEASKSGVLPQEVNTLAQAIEKLPRLQLRGLMAIPAPTPDLAVQHSQFRLVRELFETLRARNNDPLLDTLSIGMSEDFPIAIAEGATIVRVGSAIFGSRPITQKPAD